jgi:hypothetical protein
MLWLELWLELWRAKRPRCTRSTSDDSTKALIVFAAFTLVAAMISMPSAREREQARETLDGIGQSLERIESLLGRFLKALEEHEGDEPQQADE